MTCLHQSLPEGMENYIERAAQDIVRRFAPETSMYIVEEIKYSIRVHLLRFYEVTEPAGIQVIERLRKTAERVNR